MVHKNFMDSTRNNSAAAVYSDSATRKAIRHNFINVKTKGAGAIVGFAVHSDALIIFKTDNLACSFVERRFPLERHSLTGAPTKHSRRSGEVFFSAQTKCVTFAWRYG